jgi:hypothetical protein
MKEELSNKILHLHRTTKLNFKEIGDELGIHYTCVARVCKKHGLSSHYNKSINIIDGDKAKCTKCLEVKSSNLFEWRKKNTPQAHQLSYCNTCRRQDLRQYLNRSADSFLADRYNKLKRTSKLSSIPFTISKEEFLAQYHTQEGKCFYTDLDMPCKVGEGKHRNGLSVDKIIPSKGYVLGNVVFCSNKVNSVKTDLSLDEIRDWIPGWYQRILDFMSSQDSKT